MNEIPNNKLTENDLPPPNVDWTPVRLFALSFNGYDKWGSFGKCADIANDSLEKWREKEILPNSLTEIRTCLFFEQRRWTHSGSDPDEEAMIYLHALVETIRRKIVANELD